MIARLIRSIQNVKSSSSNNLSQEESLAGPMCPKLTAVPHCIGWISLHSCPEFYVLEATEVLGLSPVSRLQVNGFKRVPALTETEEWLAFLAWRGSEIIGSKEQALH